jgi:hypothetical protein
MSANAVGLVRVISPDTETELAAIVDMLEAREVPCFVTNPRPGPRGVSGRVDKPRTILVPAARLAEAVALIGALQGTGAAHGCAAPKPSSGRLRALVRSLFTRRRPG